MTIGSALDDVRKVKYARVSACTKDVHRSFPAPYLNVRDRLIEFYPIVCNHAGLVPWQ